MQHLAILFRTMQLFSHNAHNLAKGSTFFQDHEFLGELYPVYESAYDCIVERILGLGGDIDLVDTARQAASGVDMIDATRPFSSVLEAEKLVCSAIEDLIKTSEMSEGTRQMLGNLCDESEVRQYKIGRRIK